MRPSSPRRKSMRPTSRMPSTRTAVLEIVRSRASTSRGSSAGQRTFTFSAAVFFNR